MRVTAHGKLVWSGAKPFTFYDAIVTEQGLIAGYCYTHGLNGWAPKGQRPKAKPTTSSS
jgi:hypothetical protein